ncbi:hypothetical protein PtB15_12B49 [Puccinia triticina]|nr:hypothetical protein PtB15_12B49 [Puccinia triticina]
MKRTRGLSHDIMPPAGADPFADISHLAAHRFTARLPQSAIILLAVFLVFHILIAAFNLAILIFPYVGRAKRQLWTYKKLYIYDRSGEKLYSTPLYLVNAGVLMSVSQLLSSVTTQVYILMHIRMNLSEHYALRCQFIPVLGLVFIFDTYSYWSMAHCFLALYYSNKNFAVKPKRLSWLRSPRSINIFFLIFPIFVTVATIIVITRMSMVYHDLQVQTTSLRATLAQGTLIWKQLELPGHSAEEIASLSSQLTTVQSRLGSLLVPTGTLALKLLDRFNSIRSVMLFFIPATSLYKSRGDPPTDLISKADLSDSWHAQSNSQHISVRSHVSPTSLTLFQTLQSDPQFLRLTIRAFATLLGMLVALVFWVLAIFKSNDMMIDPFWHGLATWLPAVSGTWTAIPLAWQSWRLYLDQNPGTVDLSYKLEETASTKEHPRTARS